MNSLAKTLPIQNPSAFSILTVYKYIYKIKWFFDQAGTYYATSTAFTRPKQEGNHQEYSFKEHRIFSKLNLK